jgi:outer membrane lipoprotein-sorting protein
MRTIESMQTRFIQKKNLSLFSREIELRGVLAMEKPDRFIWRTEFPLKYAILVEKEKLSQWDEDSDQVQTLSYADTPAVKIVVEQMRTWFYGEYGSLLDQYQAEVLSRQPLVLKLVPGEKSPARGMIRSVTLSFKSDQSYIESILIEEKNGDRSEMLFKDTVLNSKIEPSVWKIKNAA